jgi:hypothetical protein
MAYLLKNNAVFLHVPKTGGTYVYELLRHLELLRGPLGNNHTDFERTYWHAKLHHNLKVMRYIVREWMHLPTAQLRMKPGAFTFCFVREPLEWYESWWRFMMSIKWRKLGDESNPHKWAPTAMLNGLGSPDFNTFVRNVNRKRPGFVTEMYGWYVRPGVTFVGKMENLHKDLMKVFALMHLNIPEKRVLEFPPRNETPARVPKPQWDPELRRETLRLEYAGYVRFGYPVDEELLVTH